MDIVAPSLIPNLQECAILLDVDGTILDFASTPLEVWVPPSLRHDMARLSERTGGALALVSGRSLSELDLLFSPLQLPAIGGHGAEFRPHVGGELDLRRAVSLDPSLKRAFAKVAEIGPGILIEDKGYAIGLHYRLAPDLEDAVEAAVDRICADHPAAPVEILRGPSGGTGRDPARKVRHRDQANRIQQGHRRARADALSALRRPPPDLHRR